MTSRGPLAPLAGVPGLPRALARAAVAALVQAAGLVLLSGGLALAVARVAGLADGPASTPLALATAGAVLRAATGSLGELWAARDARRAEDELRRALLERLAASPGAVAAAGGPGPAAVLATTRLHDLGPGLATYLPALAQTLVVPPVLLLVLAVLDLRSAVLVGITLPLVPLFMVLVGKHTRDETTAAARALDRIAASVAELVRGLPVLVGLGRAADQAAALADLGAAHRERTLATLRIAFLSALVLELIATLSVALVAVTVGLRLVHGGMPLAVGLTALLLAPEAFAPLRALGAAHHANEDAALAAAEARAVLAVPPPASPEPGDDGPVALDVRGLAVRYPGRRFPALPPADLRVDPGELVAVTGASGSGKSTLLAVLAGVLPPDAEVSGSVHGVPAGAVAYAAQHPTTTGATVTDELRRHAGGEDAADDADAVATALAQVAAGHLADRPCPTLSPGELQRVALARALVRVRCGARLLLLDEPTAHLDDDAAAVVAGVLAGLRGRVTTLLVTHEPTLAALADRVIPLPSPAGELPAPAAVSTPSARDATSSPEADVTSRARDLASPVAPPARPQAGSLRWPRMALARAVVTGALSAGSGIALTAVSGWLIVRAAQLPPVLTLMVAIVGVRAFGLSRAGLRWAERMTAHDAALRLAERTRVRVWRALSRQGIAADRTPGSALARVVGDIRLLQDLSVRVLPPVLVAGAVSAATVGVLALLEPRAAGVVALVLAGAAALVVLVHRRVDAGAARHESALRVATLQETATVLEGAGELRAHGLGPRVAAELDRLARRQGVVAHTGARAAALGTGLVVLGTGLAAVLAVTVSAAAGLSGPAVAVLALAPLALADPLAGLVTGLQRRGALADARDRLTGVLTAPVPAEPVEPAAVPAPISSVAVSVLRAGWPGGPDVLRDVSARAAADGGWLVVRGPSGTGKSTFLAVLMAALRPRGGHYTVAGVPASGLAGDELRSGMAWLPQEAHVFASTIRANLALVAPRGVLAGDHGERRMRAVLAAVGLGPLLAGLPEGLDTPVGAGGTALSGGERRRLAAARALLADRDVVLLDEPTAHLDPPTAAALLHDLRAALAGRVVVCVTHDGTVERPGDAVLRLGETAVELAA